MSGMHGTGSHLAIFCEFTYLRSLGGTEDREFRVVRLVSLFMPKLYLSLSLDELKFRENSVEMLSYT